MKRTTQRLGTRGQTWWMDYTFGMLIFVIAVSVVATIVINEFDEREFESILEETNRVANTLMTDGYPADWDESDVVRAGIMSDGRVSHRKLDLLATFSEEHLHTLLPINHPFAIVFEQTDGTVRPIGDHCSIGNAALPTTQGNRSSMRNVAYYSRSAGNDTLRSWAQLQDADEYVDSEIEELLAAAHQYGLIILEDPSLDDLVATAINSTRTAAELRTRFRSAARYGPIFIITGSMGVPILGAETVVNASNESTILNHNESYFFLNQSAQLNMTGDTQVVFLAETGEGELAPTGGAVHTRTIAQASGDTTAARWQYEDSLVYYFQGPEGRYDDAGAGSSWESLLQDGLDRARRESSINCTAQPEALASNQLSKIERILADRGSFLHMTIYVWEQ